MSAVVQTIEERVPPFQAPGSVSVPSMICSECLMRRSYQMRRSYDAQVISNAFALGPTKHKCTLSGEPCVEPVYKRSGIIAKHCFRSHPRLPHAAFVRRAVQVQAVELCMITVNEKIKRLQCLLGNAVKPCCLLRPQACPPTVHVWSILRHVCVRAFLILNCCEDE